MAPHATMSLQETVPFSSATSLKTEGISDHGSVKNVKKELTHRIDGSSIDAKTVQTIRGLVLDCCQQYGIGHGGSALGMAAIATALWKHRLRFDPATPDWFDRDRFVLSNGHVGLLNYIMLHLSGYKAWTMDELKAYCHPTANNFTNLAKTHPEIEFDGLDMSTGPLGQGVANAVGMAIANKHAKSRFNRDGFEVVKGRVYCVTGDACLQEGPALEAISLAGHLKLDNLTLIYDNNAVQSDGPITLTCTEDVNAKMRACGWHVLEIRDANTNVKAIVRALEHASDHEGQPVFLNMVTTIGHGTPIAGLCKAHHAAFGAENVQKCKESWGFDAEQTHVVPQDVRDYWSEVPRKGARLAAEWDALLADYADRFPDLAREYTALAHGKLDATWKDALMAIKTSTKKMPVRQASGEVLDILWKKIPMMGGSADLSEPNFVLREPKEAFGPSEDGVRHCSYNGRYVHWGTREHAMAACANGIAAYSRKTEHDGQAFIPITATFAMFQLYAGPAIRMSALSNLKIIHIGTHDSIAEGACGPTHQPVELLNLWRSVPNLLHIRPADAEEAIGAWMMALEHDGPTVLGLNRGAVPLQAGSSRTKMQQGAYVILENPSARVTIVSTGGDVAQAVDAADILQSSGVSVRMVSMPCMRRFEEQDKEYIASVIPWDGRPVVSVEAMSTHGWARWSTASIGMKTFGTTVHADAVMGHFELTGEHIARRITGYLHELGTQDARLQPWQDI